MSASKLIVLFLAENSHTYVSPYMMVVSYSMFLTQYSSYFIYLFFLSSGLVDHSICAFKPILSINQACLLPLYLGSLPPYIHTLYLSCGQGGFCACMPLTAHHSLFSFIYLFSFFFFFFFLRENKKKGSHKN